MRQICSYFLYNNISNRPPFYSVLVKMLPAGVTALLGAALYAILDVELQVCFGDAAPFAGVFCLRVVLVVAVAFPPISESSVVVAGVVLT